MTTIAKHTSYIVINEKNDLEIVSYSPDQNYEGRRDCDQYILAQGLFICNISHELWLGEYKCDRVIGTPSGLQSIKNLKCKVVAKKQYDWDMSKPIGYRKSNVKKSAKWDELYNIIKNKIA